MAEKLYRKTSSGYEEVYNLNYIKNILWGFKLLFVGI